ncbi:MAG: polymer-forming cytoskeletal protein [Gemmatimonadota bacterium]
MNARVRTLAAALLAVSPLALGAQGQSRADLDRDLKRLSKGEQIAGVPPADSVSVGPRSIAAGTVVRGTVVAKGPVDVYGRVEGSVVSLAGDVNVHTGGSVTGDALAVGGHVNADSGRVDGEMRAMASLPIEAGAILLAARPRTAAERTAEATKIVAATFSVLLCVAVGVLLFAGPNLNEVVATIELRFSRAFWYGLLGQLVALPVLALLVVALALTLIGVLLIPFAIVAYAIAVIGLVTLGFLATARLVGGAIWKTGETNSRVRGLGALAVGIALFFVLWMVAAILTGAPLAATVVRAAALAASWAAMTLGLGAALLSRAGTHKRVPAGTTKAVEFASWQTPTPVAGVVAARRSVSTTREGSHR